jgi:hypothetical protein
MKAIKFPGPDGTEIDAQEVDTIESIDRWCEFKLEDGTVIRAKPVVAAFVRVDGMYDPQGSPLYAIKGGITHIVISVPDALKKRAD